MEDGSTFAPTSTDGNIMTATEATADEYEENAIVLDPKNSDRQYYRDPYTSLQREVWRPGDGDGDRKTDYFDKPGPPPELEKRWRLYQSSTGTEPVKHEVNEPPKYVILDDRTAYQVLASDLSRSHIVKWWPHDFGGAGKLRHRRPHRGRGAIGDEDAEGNNKYHFTHVGTRDDKYFFTGEADYKPIIYISSEPEAPKPQPKKPKGFPGSRATGIANPRNHGHNQYTPKDQLVKCGAPHKGTTYLRYRPKVNAFLPRDPSPDFPIDKSFHYSKERKHQNPSKHGASMTGVQDVDAEDNTDELVNEDSLWVESTGTAQRNKRKRAAAPMPEDLSAVTKDSSSDLENCTFTRLSTKPLSIGSPSPESEIAQPRRKKLAQTEDFFHRYLADQEAADETATAAVNTTKGPEMIFDSGSYASQVEQELAMAKTTIEEQKSKIDELQLAHNGAQGKIKALEAEITALKDKLGSTEDAINAADNMYIFDKE